MHFVSYCPMKNRSVEPFACLDLLSELWQSTLFQILPFFSEEVVAMSEISKDVGDREPIYPTPHSVAVVGAGWVCGTCLSPMQ